MPGILAISGAAVLMFVWAGPLPQRVADSFAAHMTLHMTVVGIGVPLLAAGLAPALARRGPLPQALPVIASLLDLVIVWLWHAPALHHAARSGMAVLALEQASFAGVALLLWLAALAGPPLAGAMALFFTAMHMTLLGALLGLAPRPIFQGHDAHGGMGLSALQDQQLGGVIMLAIGSLIYLGSGLALAGRALRQSVPS